MREKLGVLLPWLSALLSQDAGAGWRLETAGQV
jgi:hypothetical protein